MNETQINQKLMMSDEEKKRLIAYFNVLIEMDFELKKLVSKEQNNA